MKNTKIQYLYRDGSNYKMRNMVIVKGTITEEQIETIMDCLDGREFFIPRQVGLPEERIEEEWNEDDHCWFELCADDFSVTDEEETEDMTVEDLVSNFAKMKGKWEEFSEYEGEEEAEDE